MNMIGFRENKKNIPSSNNVLPRKNASPGTVSNSFAAVLKSGSVNHNTVTESSPAIVLDDACIMERDFSCSLMGKMKDINALSNLFIILANEGFENVKLFYLGGQWVLLELDSVTSKEKITNHVGVGSWFEVLKPACNSFVCEERLVWVAIEGLPVKALTRNTYAKIIASWGELVDINESDNCSLSCIRVCVRTKPRVLINDRVKIIIKGQLHWICVKEQEAWMPEFKTVMEDDTSSDEESEGNNENDRGSDNEHVSETSFAHENVDEFQVNPKPSCNTVISEDPFGIYKILKRNKDANVTEGDTHTPQYPPGFTPNVEENVVDNIPGNASQPKPNPTTSGNKEKASSVNDKFQASGSILEVMDELIKVGQTMGYNMDGCLGNKAKKGWIQELNTKHRVNFVALQETKMEKMDLFSIKALWGNLSFDYAFSPSIGYSGGILCVWDPRLFVKDNSTVSDSFWRSQDLTERSMLWDFIHHLIDSWDGECVLLGDFNEVRFEHERRGSLFNSHGANSFNNFITRTGLIDLPLEGYSFTWAHKSASKMSKLDRILISEGLLALFPSILALSLDKHLSDHRPILLLELNVAYGPTPFRFFHSWSSWKGFDKMVEDWWKNSVCMESNSIIKLKKKLQSLKSCRILTSLHGVLVDGDWIVEPSLVKNEFLKHFATRFAASSSSSITFDYQFPNRLTPDQIEDLKLNVSYEEIKRAVWDCRISKSPGRLFPPGCNSSFITLIPKSQEAKMVKEFRPISLIGSMYKIITKVLANCLSLVISELVSYVQSAFVSNRHILDHPFMFNELLSWCKHKKSKALIFKIDFEKAFDSVRWDYLNVVLANFGFGLKWRSWIQGCPNSAMGSILVNGSPTLEFKFSKGLKQGDPLSPFLFILIMESLHISFNIMVNAGLYNGIQIDESLNLSHLFYADDVIFVGKWNSSNLSTIVNVLKWFYLASGLKINLNKSKFMGIGISHGVVASTAKSIGCSILHTPFNYLGVKVGGIMSRLSSWDDVIAKLSARLSKWKLKSLSIGGRLTLIKSVLSSLPLYYMSSFKVPKGVLSKMESIRRNFFNGVENAKKKMSLIGWNKNLASKKNRAIYGIRGALDNSSSYSRRSPWLDIVNEVRKLASKGIDPLSLVKKKVGNGEATSFWNDVWLGDFPLN
ncbi:RNA-directed DNA polymerase, eukaryota [Tanacetum coccineum]